MNYLKVKQRDNAKIADVNYNAIGLACSDMLNFEFYHFVTYFTYISVLVSLV